MNARGMKIGSVGMIGQNLNQIEILLQVKRFIEMGTSRHSSGGKK